LIYNKIKAGSQNTSGAMKILLFVYYSGHGVMDTTTKIVLNVQEEEKRYYELETVL